MHSLAKSTDTRSTDYVGTIPDLGATQISDLPDVGINEGPSDFDMRHSLTGAFSWELPSPGVKIPGRILLKGWALDGIIMARQGHPIDAERVKIDLRAEYFNVFNHPNLAIGANDVYWARHFGAFGYATMMQNSYLSGSFYSNQGGGLSQQYQTGGPRSGQLTLKVSF